MHDLTALTGHSRDLTQVTNSLTTVIDADTHTAEVVSGALAELADLISQLGRVLAS